MEHDKKRHEITWDKHERQLSHGARGYLPVNADSEGGRQRPGANGHK